MFTILLLDSMNLTTAAFDARPLKCLHTMLQDHSTSTGRSVSPASDQGMANSCQHMIRSSVGCLSLQQMRPKNSLAGAASWVAPTNLLAADVLSVTLVTDTLCKHKLANGASDLYCRGIHGDASEALSQEEGFCQSTVNLSPSSWPSISICG